MTTTSSPAPQILILNGPNLNLLGRREPETYGSVTLAQIGNACAGHAETLGATIDFRQTNAESELIDWVHEARETSAAIILNAAAYTHTSIALLDALRTFSGPIIEVHLTNIHKREAFRRHSYVALTATGTICGLGPRGYLLALDAAVDILANGRARGEEQEDT